MSEEIYHHLLRSAVAEGNLFNVRRLVIRKGLPLTCPDPANGWPTLFYAIRYQQNDIVDFLLEAGHENEEISRDFDLNTALIIAADYKNTVAFNAYLSRYPSTLTLSNSKGKTPLIVASERGVNDIVLTLLNNGVDFEEPDVDGSTPLHHAAAWGHFDTITILLERGADCLVKNVKGWTPLDYAYSMDVKDHIQECVNAISENRPIRNVIAYRSNQVLSNRPSNSTVDVSFSNSSISKKRANNINNRIDLRTLF